MNPKKLLRKVAPKKAISLAEESYRKGRIATAHISRGLPSKGLKVIAITGTNGKTSTCCFLNDVLKSSGYKTALFTTAVIEMDGKRTVNQMHRTVPPTHTLFGFLKEAKKHRVDFVILETTSHALHQHKLWGIPIEIAGMTNVTQDHLDYHGTMEKYAESKARLFSSYMKPKWCVLNSDDEWFDYFATKSIGKVYTYGKSDQANMKISQVHESSDGLTLTLEGPSGVVAINAPVIGQFNAYNLALVATICSILEIDTKKMTQAFKDIQGVPGRMEVIRAKDFSVVIDYAHAPDALEKALLALRAITTKSVRVVFGATGDRDKSKRPLMGEIAALHADSVYLTDDETYTEDGDVIREEVREGILRHTKEFAEIPDRRKAIEQAINDSKAGDIVLVAGLGHQNYRAMNEGNIAWQETDVVREILLEHSKKK